MSAFRERLQTVRRAPATRKAIHAAAFAGYYGVARHLPASHRPGGQVFRRIRGALVSRMLDRSGAAINIEQGAKFGSGRGISVGDRGDLGSDCLVMGSARIGADVMMGPRCILISTNHHFDDVTRPMNTQGLTEDQPVIVEDDVWIGAGCILLPGVRVGRGSVIAAGAVVAGDIPPYSIAGGVPARVLRSRLPGESRDPSALAQPGGDAPGAVH